MSVTFSTRALGRSLGTTDPSVIQAAADMLSDPEAEWVVRYEQDSTDDGSEPNLEWCEPAEEVDRIVKTYLNSPHGPGLTNDSPSSEIARIVKTYLTP